MQSNNGNSQCEEETPIYLATCKVQVGMIKLANHSKSEKDN